MSLCGYVGPPLTSLSKSAHRVSIRPPTLKDHDTALSAVRNLQEVVVNGRNLRVELSPDEPYKPRTGPPAAGNRGASGGGNGGFQPPPQGMGMNTPDMGFGNRPPGAAGFGGAGGFTPPPASNAFPARPPPPSMGPGAQGINLGMLPPGQDVPPGMKATDVISKTLASIPPGKLEEVLTGMKVGVLVALLTVLSY